MALTESQILTYLLDRDLLDPEVVVDGHYVAIPETRRNSNVKVTLGGNAPGFFVKQSTSGDQMNAGFIHREAACYWLARSHPELAGLASVQPPYHGFDATQSMLVVGLVEPAETVGVHHFRTQAWPPELGAAMGRMLATYLADSPAIAELGAGILPRQDPWALTIAEQGTPVFLPRTQGVNYLLEALARHPGFAESLRALRDQWQLDHLIHGDVKFDNILGRVDDDGEIGDLTLVDWELVGFGDAAWDIGSIIQEYLVWSLIRLELAPNAPSDVVDELAAEALDGVRPAITAFWKAFAEDSADTGPKPDDDLLHRSVACAGARMIQTTLEHTSFGAELTANLVAVLQQAHNLLQDPVGTVPLLLEDDPA